MSIQELERDNGFPTIEIKYVAMTDPVAADQVRLVLPGPDLRRPRRRRRLPRLPVGWLKRQRKHVPLLGVLILVTFLNGWNLTNYPALSDDEGTYLAQAWAVQNGVGLAHYTYWYDHPPLGWIQLALFSWIPALLSDGPAVAGARVLMLVVTLVSTLGVYLLARRMLFARWASVLAVLLFGLSPLAVTLHRQVYLDNIAVAWMLAAFVLALSPRRAMWTHTGAGVAAAVAILSKETIALALPGLIVALWQGTHRSTRKFSLAGFGCGLILIGSIYPLYALLKGELFPGEGHVSLLGAMFFQVADRDGSGSILVAGTGANDLLQAWLFYDPVLLVGGVAAVLLTLPSRRMRPVAVAGTVFVLMALRPGGYLPAMYVIQVLPFFALALSGLVTHLHRRLWRASDPSLVASPQHRMRATGLAVVSLMVAVVLLPPWIDGTRRAATASENRPYQQAVTWLAEHVHDPAQVKVAVDNVIWLDLVNRGFTPGTGAIWFYKLDLDPQARLPHGWRDLDYIVTSPIVRQDASGLPTVAGAIDNSEVVAVFGHGDGRLEIRRIQEDK